MIDVPAKSDNFYLILELSFQALFLSLLNFVCAVG